MNFKKHPEGFLYAKGMKGIYVIKQDGWADLYLITDDKIEYLAGDHTPEKLISYAQTEEYEYLLERLTGSIITEEVMEL